MMHNVVTSYVAHRRFESILTYLFVSLARKLYIFKRGACTSRWFLDATRRTKNKQYRK